MELRHKEGVCEETNDDGTLKKCCCDCKATKTPLWRAGPAGPKSLCNACGLRYRKKAFIKNHRRKEVAVFQRQRSIIKRRISTSVKTTMMKKMGEVEQAACLLMALSCGSVLA